MTTATSLRPRQRVGGDAAVILGVSLVVGVLIGLVLPHLVTPVEMVRTEMGLSTGEIDVGHRFDTVAWFSLLTAPAGLLLGALFVARRRTDEVVTVALVVLGGLAGAWVAAQVGHWAGPSDPVTVLAEAKLGATAPEQVTLTAEAAYLVWPIAGLVSALMVLWSRPEGRRRHPHPLPDQETDRD